MLRIEVVVHNTQELRCGRSLENFPRILDEAKSILRRFMDALSCIGQCFIADEMLEELPAPAQVGRTRVGGIDLNHPRMRQVTEAVIALSPSPGGFTASQLASQVRALCRQSESEYGPRRAAYDLKKLRGKQIVRRIDNTRRYEAIPKGLKPSPLSSSFAPRRSSHYWPLPGNSDQPAAPRIPNRWTHTMKRSASPCRESSMNSGSLRKHRQ